MEKINIIVKRYTETQLDFEQEDLGNFKELLLSKLSRQKQLPDGIISTWINHMTFKDLVNSLKYSTISLKLTPEQTQQFLELIKKTIISYYYDQIYIDLQEIKESISIGQTE